MFPPDEAPDERFASRFADRLPDAMADAAGEFPGVSPDLVHRAVLRGEELRRRSRLTQICAAALGLAVIVCGGAVVAAGGLPVGADRSATSYDASASVAYAAPVVTGTQVLAVLRQLLPKDVTVSSASATGTERGALPSAELELTTASGDVTDLVVTLNRSSAPTPGPSVTTGGDLGTWTAQYLAADGGQVEVREIVGGDAPLLTTAQLTTIAASPDWAAALELIPATDGDLTAASPTATTPAST